WTAHGATLNSSFEIRYKRFIILALDQEINAASGCSIYASVHFIQQLEKDYNVDLLDKMNVSYKQGEFIAYKQLNDFRKMAKEKLFPQKPLYLIILSTPRRNIFQIGKYLPLKAGTTAF
ncbi:MAG TPA: hypothetical protein VK833_02230, partial [Gillisia sp.]|nr:hypothetical protein [Gillisia sp.]